MTEQWKKSSARFGWLAGAVGAAVLTFSLLTLNSHTIAQPAAPRAPAAVGVSFADVIESVSPAVVNIMVSKVEAAAPTVVRVFAAGRAARPAAVSVRVLRAVLRRRSTRPACRSAAAKAKARAS